jgi:hypothetical protein
VIKVLESGHLGGGTQSVMSGQDRYQFAQDAQHNKLSSLESMEENSSGGTSSNPLSHWINSPSCCHYAGATISNQTPSKKSSLNFFKPGKLRSVNWFEVLFQVVK